MSDNNAIKRPRATKPPRKGTHSCIECRRRKIRCLWPAGTDRCNACIARDARCELQTLSQPRAAMAKKNKTLREKVNELEKVIGGILNQMQPSDTATAALQHEANVAELLRDLHLELEHPIGLPPSSVEAINSSRDTHSAVSNQLCNAPALTLFDNAVFCRDDDEENDGLSAGSPGSGREPLPDRSFIAERDNRIFQCLKALAPSPEAIDLLLGQSRLSLCLLRRNFPDIPGFDGRFLSDLQFETLRDHIVGAFHSNNLSILAKAALTLAACIQQLPPGFSLGSAKTPAPLEVLESCYLQSVETLLASDDGIVGTIDGLECLLALIQYHLHGGLPRKSWVLLHRCITFAHLLNGSSRSVPGSKPFHRTRALWDVMWTIDKTLSLLLGLPDSLKRHPYRVDLNGPEGTLLPGPVRFHSKLTSIAERVIDRNTSTENMNYGDTMHLERDLEGCKPLMPPTFWQPNWGPESPPEVVYESSTLKFWYCHLRVLLHLPFVLKCFHDRQYSFSVHAALESARGMIQCYFVMRDESRNMLRNCHMVDFQSFTASMVVILCTMSDFEDYDLAQRESDLALVQELIVVMRRVSDGSLESVAAQGAQLLETLTAKLRQTHTSGREEKFSAVIPYFGRLTIKRRGMPPPDFGLDMNEMDVSFPSLDPHFRAEDLMYWPQESTNWASLVELSLQDEWHWDTSGFDSN